MEFSAITAIQGIENLLLITPMVYLYFKVQERHSFLLSTIGPVLLETLALETIGLFVTVSISAAIINIPLQIVLYWIYNLKGHPWKRFLQQIYLEEEDQFPGMVGLNCKDETCDDKIEERETLSLHGIHLIDAMDFARASSEYDVNADSTNLSQDNASTTNQATENPVTEPKMDDLSPESRNDGEIEAALAMLREVLKF